MGGGMMGKNVDSLRGGGGGGGGGGGYNTGKESKIDTGRVECLEFGMMMSVDSSALNNSNTTDGLTLGSAMTTTITATTTTAPRKSSKSKNGKSKSKNGNKISKSVMMDGQGIESGSGHNMKENVDVLIPPGQTIIQTPTPAPTPTPTQNRGRSSRKPRKPLPNFSSGHPPPPPSITTPAPGTRRPRSNSPTAQLPTTSFRSVEYQSLEDLLSRAGYKDTRVFTPEAEKLKKMIKERGLRKVKSTLDSPRSLGIGMESPVISKDQVGFDIEVNDSIQSSLLYQPVENSSSEFTPAPSTSASSNSWWTNLALPWGSTTNTSDDSPVGMTGSSAKYALEAALRSTMEVLEDPYVVRRIEGHDGIRKMRSENDIPSRVTGFDWSDEPLQSRIKVPRAEESPANNVLERLSPRHWSDIAVNDRDSTWGDGSPIKRKRKVLNRVALEIEVVRPVVPAVVVQAASDDGQIVFLRDKTPAEEHSPMTSSTSGASDTSDATIRPLLREASTETTESDDILEVEGEIELADGELSGIRVPTTPRRQQTPSTEESIFDPLAYEAGCSGDFDRISVCSSSHDSSSLSTTSVSESPPHTVGTVATPPRSQSRVQTPVSSPSPRRTASPPAVSLTTASTTFDASGTTKPDATITRQLKNAQSVPALVYNRLADEPLKGGDKPAGWFPAFGMPWSRHTAVRPPPTMQRSAVSSMSTGGRSQAPPANPQLVNRPLPPRAVTSLMSTTRPASPKLVRGDPIVCDSNRAEDLPPFTAATNPPIEPSIVVSATVVPGSRFKTLRNVFSLSALKFAQMTSAPTASTSVAESTSPTLSPRLEWTSDNLDWSSNKPQGFNALYKHKDDSPRYQYTDNVDEVEAYNETVEQAYHHEPDFTQSFFYQPPTPPRPVDETEVDTPRREAKRTQSIKSLRAHLLKQSVVSKSSPPKDEIPPVPAVPKQFAQPQAIIDRRPPPPVFAISSPGATEAGLPPRELILEGEEWDAGSLESNRWRGMSGVKATTWKVERKLSKRPSLRRRKSGTR